MWPCGGLVGAKGDDRTVGICGNQAEQFETDLWTVLSTAHSLGCILCNFPSRSPRVLAGSLCGQSYICLGIL